METIFIILVFVTFFAVIVGLFKPSAILFWDSRQTRGRVVLYGLAVFLALSVLYGMFIEGN